MACHLAWGHCGDRYLPGQGAAQLDKPKGETLVYAYATA